MRVLKLILMYQCSLCFSTSIEPDDSSLYLDANFENEGIWNPLGILARGPTDAGKFESILNSLLFDSDGTNKDKWSNTESINLLPVQQKRFGSFNMVTNEVKEQQRAIPHRTSFNAVRSFGMIFSRPFRPIIRLEVNAESIFGHGMSFMTSVPLRPSLEIVDAIFSAALQQYLRNPKQSNPYNVIIDYDVEKDCDVVVSALNIPNDGTHTWKVKVTRRRGRVIYDDECVTTSRRIRLRHGTTVTVYYA